ncbi:hypothetical protein B6D52_03055 [Candidatus Parcubacteria bacterium 4484_255]|nr:MAG: hypothetical protein B6D52_03055 [Candidatus Parcubacteria bacterium 4484_255]
MWTSNIHTGKPTRFPSFFIFILTLSIFLQIFKMRPIRSSFIEGHILRQQLTHWQVVGGTYFIKLHFFI